MMSDVVEHPTEPQDVKIKIAKYMEKPVERKTENDQENFPS